MDGAGVGVLDRERGEGKECSERVMDGWSTTLAFLRIS